MSNPKALCVEGEFLRAIAVMNGRAKADVKVSRIASDIVIHSDEMNPVAAKQRDAFIECMPESPPFMREETASLLGELAELVMHERANAEPDKKQTPDVFPTIDPWRSAVNGELLLDDLVAFLNRYMVLPPYAAEAIALWLVHTYLFDVADYTPYLLVTSPVRECGKTTLLEILLHVAHRAQMTGGITAAALYRRIDRLAPTMLLDELDTRLRGDAGEVLRGVLNNGFQRSGGKITICVGEDHEDRDFAVFCPKVLAGIGRVWDTVTSRSIPLRLARASKGELARLTKLRGDRIGEACLPYRQKLLRWANDNREALRVSDTVAPGELGARQCDVWRPLFAVADAAGTRWSQLARKTAIELHGVAEEEGDYGLLMLQDLKALFDSRGEPALPSAAIVEAFAAMEDRPWPEYRNGHPISTRGLASLVGRFKVKPKNIRYGGEVPKGYVYSDLLPAFTTYLTPPNVSATSATGARAGGVADVADGTGDPEDLRGEAWEPEDVVGSGGAEAA